jgi:DNA-binding winged helix-turn-helix (wHTH) protein/tetratricopeptide (TPR) repeat protein/TolB-like protein
MDTSSPNPPVYRFGTFEANAASRQLFRQGVRVRLQEQPFQLLVLLVERPGILVTREDLRQQLWSADTYVDFDNSLKVAVKKLRDALGDDADNPRFIETVPRQGYRFIASVAVVAMERPASDTPAAPQVEASSTATATPVMPTPDAAARPQSQVLRIGIGVVAIFAVLGFLTFVRPRLKKKSPKPESAAAATITPRRSVAVLGFRNASGKEDAAWLSTALSEMLSTELAAGNQLRLVSGEEIANARHGTEWPTADSLGQDSASRLGSALSSDLLVTGSYTVIGSGQSAQVRLDARLQDAHNGHIITEAAGTSTAQDIFPLVSHVGSRLREELALPGITGDQFAGIRASVSSNVDAERFYSLGLEKMRSYEAVTARDLFEQAIKLDPQFSMAHWALANALDFLGYDQLSKLEAKRALDGSAQLPQPERLMIEGFYYEDQSDWKKAASTYRSLYALFPDSLDYGFRLARAEWVGGESVAAQDLIHHLRQLPAPESSDPRIDLWEARVTASVDRNISIELAQTAARKAQALGLRLTYAHARLEECRGLGWAGHPHEALVACEEARDIFLKAGDRFETARTAWQMADRFREQGLYADALRYYDEAEKHLREVGNRASLAAVLNNMALVYEAQGEFARAGKLYEESAQKDRETGETANLADAMTNIASVRSKAGDLKGALQASQESVNLTRSQNPDLNPDCLTMAASLQQSAGNLEEALELAGESVSIERKVGDAPELINALMAVGDALAAQANFAGARKNYEEALVLAQKSNAAATVANLQVSLADLAMSEHHPADAEPLLREALREFTKEKAASSTMQAQMGLARSLLAQSKLVEAQKVAGDARASAHMVHDYQLVLDFSALQAQIDAAGGHESPGKLAGDLARLRSAIAGANKRGYFEAAAKAQLILLEIQTHRNPTAPRSEVEKLMRSCQSRGYITIANRAQSLLKS